MILYKNVSGKKSSYGGKCMATMDVTTMEKRGLVLKTTLAILNMQMNRRKALLMNKSQTWPHFLKVQDFFLQIYFFKDFNSCNLISWDFIGSPHIILRKSLKLRTLFPVGFFYQSFHFQVFFPKHFFLWLS